MTDNPLLIYSFGWVAKLILVGIIFLLTCTNLGVIPMDKAIMSMMVAALILDQILMDKPLKSGLILPLIVVMGLFFVSYLLNLPDSSLIIFFPIIGLFFVALISQEPYFIEVFYRALFIHIVLGIFLVIISYLIGMNPFVHPMYDKGLPFLHAAKGLTTTVQTYGTLIISWFLIYYYKKENNKLGVFDRLAYYFVFLGMILTFNRNTVLIYYVIIFFKHRKLFILSIIAVFLFYFYYFEFINKLIFNFSTLTSRADLLQAFREAFFNNTGWLGYLIGHGNNVVGDEIAMKTFYKTGYIENGTSVLLYTYGFIGYAIYLISVLIFSILFLVRGKTFYAAMVFYIFIIAQQFTHEFYSSTLYIMLGTFLLILHSIPPRAKKDHILSPVQ